MAKPPKPKKIMFLCAHNQSRSVTAEGLLTGEKGYEVKSRALWKGTSRRITKHEGQWADEVYVMMPGMVPVAEEAGVNPKKIKSLWIPDNYAACEDALLRELKAQLRRHGIYVTKSLEKAKADCWKIHDRKMGFSFRMPMQEPWWEEEERRELRQLYGEEAEEEVSPVFEEEISGHVTRPKDRFSFDYVPAPDWLGRVREVAKPELFQAQIPPERYVPVTGDESEEEIVERARRLWKFYDATDPKQKKLK